MNTLFTFLLCFLAMTILSVAGFLLFGIQLISVESNLITGFAVTYCTKEDEL